MDDDEEEEEEEESQSFKVLSIIRLWNLKE